MPEVEDVQVTVPKVKQQEAQALEKYKAPQSKGKIASFPDVARAELDELLCQHMPFSAISRVLLEKHNLKLSGVGIKEYFVREFQTSDKYKKSQLELKQTSDQWEKGLDKKKKYLVEAQQKILDGSPKVKLAVSQQIDLALTDLYKVLQDETDRPIAQASVVAGTHREIRAYLEFRTQYLKDPEVDRERKWVVMQLSVIVADLLRESNISVINKERFLDGYEEKVRKLFQE